MRASSQPLIELGITTPLGTFKASYSSRGLYSLNFPPKSVSEKIIDFPGYQASTETERWHKTAIDAVTQVLSGAKPSSIPPLDLASYTPFQRKVWEVLLSLGPGETTTYKEIACRIGNPKSVRAVGGACGRNPIPLIIPCHRVLSSGGDLGGFSGGLKWKAELLRREGVVLDLTR